MTAKNIEPMQKTERFWDRLADQFDNAEKGFEQPPVDRVRKYLRNSDVVLDYGCATGTVAIEIAPAVKAVIGIDISSKMIEAANTKKAHSKFTNVEFKQSTIFDPQLSRDSFDVLLAFNILHLIDDLPAAMQRINELMKPGGLMISVTSCAGEKKSILNGMLSLLIKLGIIPRMNFFTIPELKATITLGDLQIIEAEQLEHGVANMFIVSKKS